MFEEKKALHVDAISRLFTQPCSAPGRETQLKVDGGIFLAQILPSGGLEKTQICQFLRWKGDRCSFSCGVALEDQRQVDFSGRRTP